MASRVLMKVRFWSAESILTRPAVKEGQNMKRKTVPMREKRSEMTLEALLL